MNIDQAVQSLTEGSVSENKEPLENQNQEQTLEDEKENQTTQDVEVEDAEEDIQEDIENDETLEDVDNQDEIDEPEEDIVELASGEKITLSELLNGYERQSDYTKKTQKVAEQRKEIEVLETKTKEKLSILDQKVSELNALADSLVSQDKSSEVDLLQLAQDDPAEAMRIMAEREVKAKAEKEARDKIQAAQEELNKEREVEFMNYLEVQSEALLSKIPSWKDENNRKTEQKKLLSLAKDKYGFTEAELQIYDHRQWLVLQDAFKSQAVDAAKSKVQEKLKKAPKLLKSKTPKPKAQINSEKTKQLKSKLRTAKGRNSIELAAGLIKV